MSLVSSLRRHLLPALTGCLLLLLGALAATARADEYGGLGGLAVFKPGKNGGPLEVNPRSHRAFGVAPDGSSYIAETIEIAGKPYFRIQKLGSKGEYLAEARVKLATQPYQLDGVAIDAEKQRLYVLAVGERKGEGAQPVFDPEAPVAAELYAFSTTALEPATGTDAGLLAGETTLGALSEEAGVPLLDPHGIAVDPTTHDVLILGQQDESKKKGEEEPRAAVQRVHTEGAAEGELGPRYVDTENCLDEGEAIEAEPACAEGSGQPTSPFVSPGGRVYGMRAGELWEIPASEGAAEAFASHPKAYEAKSKRLFTIGRGQGIAGEEGIVEPLVESEQGGALAFVPTGPASGRIYLDAEITAEEGGGTVSKNKGAAVLGYDEDGGTPSARGARLDGWTERDQRRRKVPLAAGERAAPAGRRRDRAAAAVRRDHLSRHRERAAVRGGGRRMWARARDAAKVTDPNNKSSPHAQYKYVWEFGDGVTVEGSGTREFRAEHAYAIEGRYEVKLTVIDEGKRTAVQTHVVQVNAPPVLASIASLGAGNSGGGGGGGSGGGGAGRGVSGATSTHVPDATLAGTSLAVSGSGGVTLKLACPAGEASCSGTVTLRTLGAIPATAHARKRVLTLAAGSFTVVGGKIAAVTLRLSARARALLARMHVLRVQAVIVAHDPAGATHTTQAIVTLRLGRALHRR